MKKDDPAALEAIQFLLNIPAVKALAHGSSVPSDSNELFKCALTEGNTEAADVLYDLPNVRKLAKDAEFYPGEDVLKRLATNKESSMRQLTAVEQQRLSNVSQQYGPT